MLSKSKSWFKGLSAGGKAIALISGSVLTFGVVSAATNPSSSPNNPPASSESAAYSKVETREEVTTESIPYTSTTVQDNTLPSGTSQVKVAGVNGERTKTWSVTYTNGQETHRSLVSEVVTRAATDEVVAQGTYTAPSTSQSCPNGAYINSAGNSVCSPYESNSAPSGATAQCRDGTYSFSQSRSGTCSHHGGVSSWL